MKTVGVPIHFVAFFFKNIVYEIQLIYQSIELLFLYRIPFFKNSVVIAAPFKCFNFEYDGMTLELIILLMQQWVKVLSLQQNSQNLLDVHFS